MCDVLMCKINHKPMLCLNANQREEEGREGTIWVGEIGEEVCVCGKLEQSVAPRVQQIASAHTTASAN